MSDFEAYTKRTARLKALEEVLQAAKVLMAVADKVSEKSDKIKAFYDLQRAIENADRSPNPHLSLIKD